MECKNPDNFLMSWIEEAIGPSRVVSNYAHEHGYSSLWRLQATTTQEYLWLKCHQYAGKWAGEVHALSRWTPGLDLAAPRVLAYREDPLAVLVTEIPGETASTMTLEPEAEKRLWRDAGAYLARLHSLENDWLGAAYPDGTAQGDKGEDPVASIRNNIEVRLAQGNEQQLFTAKEQEFIAFGLREWPSALQGEIPRAIHRDYSPRNWMADSSGRLTGVIDFEHSRWDIRAADMNRWWDGDFITKPHLAEPFFDGYSGHMPDERQWAQIMALRLLGAVGGVVWATRVSDLPFANHNREAIHRLMRERG